jgi:hypothetical protein
LISISVVDGEDMTVYDQEEGDFDHQDVDDAEALDKLEWELASETGRITGVRVILHCH